MIASLVQRRLRARPVGEEGQLAYGGFMELSWDPGEPYEVRLAGSGPCGGEVVFARDLLISALAGHRAGEGAISAWLAQRPRIRDSLLFVSSSGPEGQLQVALTGPKVAEFLQDTIDLVPCGQESACLDLDTEIDSLLRDAA